MAGLSIVGAPSDRTTPSDLSMSVCGSTLHAVLADDLVENAPRPQALEGDAPAIASAAPW